MAYKIDLAADLREIVDGFPAELRRAWDLRLNILIDDPHPRDGAGFSVVATANRWGDRFLTLIIDEFSFAIQFDVYAWPKAEENLLGFDGRVRIFRIVPLRD